MKKFMIIFTILISSLFLIDNVSALGEEIAPYYDFDYGSGATKTSLFTELPVIKKDVSTLNDNQLANYNNILLEKENNCSNYDSYIITTKTYNGSGYTDNISLLCFNNESNQNVEPYVAVDYTTYSGNSKYAYLYYYLMLYKSDSVDYYYTAYGTSSAGNSLQMQSGQAQDDNNIIIKLYHYKDVGTTFDDSSQIIIDTNIDMTFKSTDYEIVHSPTLASFKINETIYNEGDFGYNDGILYDKSKGGTLKLKNSFNSGTNAYGMSKIVWNIQAASDESASDGIINFKLQYGANDFTNKNIPIFNSYKIYGYNEFESGWTDITNDERFYFDDFIYEYYTLEGTATETVLTSTLNIPSDICVYQQIKVEFYFDNTNNFYMYVFDDLDDSSWQDLEYYFENYMYYEFPSDMKYAFITHKENNRNVGKVYVPYNDIINPNSLFGAYIYDTQYKSVSRKLQEIEFTEHNYYYYYDFDFSFDNNEVLLLQRKIGTDEKVSFYLPSDFIVEFANDNENITILTPNGYIDIDSGKVENVFSNDSKTFVDYLNIVRNYITSIGFYITNFFGVITYFLNSLPGEALTAIITIFIVLCACVIIKLIRK